MLFWMSSEGNDTAKSREGWLETVTTATPGTEGKASAAAASPEAQRRIATGTISMLLGNAVVVPTSLIAAALMARRLGPADFGVYSVALSIIVWARITFSMLFNRASVKLIAETADWQPLAVGLIQAQLLVGVAAGLAVFVAAPLLAGGLHGSSLEPVLRVLAVTIPIAAFTQAYDNALSGRRAFGRSALMPVVYELSRLALVLALVGTGRGLMGAAYAAVGASVVTLCFVLWALPLRLWQSVSIPWRRFLGYSLPLFLDTLAKRLHKRADLWAVQALAGATAAGYYSVALSANRAGEVFSGALSPVILATVSDAWAHGREEEARGIIRHALRLSLWLTPFAAIGAGAAPALVALVFGPDYAPAAPLLAWVSFAIVALVLMSVTSAIMAALGRPGLAAAFSWPLLALALAGYWLLVPRLGAVGAAATTAVATWTAALATMAVIRRQWQAGPDVATLLRVALISAVALALTRAWQAPGLWVLGELLLLCALAVGLLSASGEVTAQDLRFARSLLRRGQNGADAPY